MKATSRRSGRRTSEGGAENGRREERAAGTSSVCFADTFPVRGEGGEGAGAVCVLVLRGLSAEAGRPGISADADGKGGGLACLWALRQDGAHHADGPLQAEAVIPEEDRSGRTGKSGERSGMRTSNFGDWRKRCPYFKSESAQQHRIVCGGVGDAVSTALIFGNREKARQLQLRVFCEGCFEKCEVYRMLAEAEPE